MRKRILLFILAALLVLGFFAREPILAASFKWYLKGYCRACLGGKLSYKDIKHEDGLWIFEKPVIISKKKLEDGGFHFKAEQATIKANVWWWERIVDLEVALISPLLNIGNGCEDIKRLILPADDEYHLFQVHSKVSIPQGTISIYNPLETDPLPLFFSIELECREAKAGCAALWLGNESKKEATQIIEAAFLKQPDNLPGVKLQFLNVNLAHLQKSLQGLFQNASFKLVQGEANGEIIIHLPLNGKFYADGQLFAKHLELSSDKFQCALDIPEISLHVSSKVTYQGEEALYQTIGHLEVPKDSEWHFLKEGVPHWSMEELKGTFAFKTDSNAAFSFTGFCLCENKRRHLDVDGRIHYGQENDRGLVVDVQLEGNAKEEDVQAHFSTRQLPEDWSIAELQFSGLGREEMEFIRHIQACQYPMLQQLHVYEGTIDGSMLFYMHHFGISKVSIENMSANHFEFAFYPWEISGKAKNASGNLTFDLSADDPMATLHADLNIADGRLTLTDMDQSRWQFADIHTNLSIRKGVLQKSIIKGIFGGLKGEILIDGTVNAPFASLSFGGPVKDIALALPERFRRGLDKKFDGDHLKVEANTTKYSKGLLFTGKAFVHDGTSRSDQISFGFSVEKTSQDLWKVWPPDSVAVEYYSGIGLNVVDALLPASAIPVKAAYSHLINHALGFSGFFIKEGWFEADNLKLEKYISPFIFPQDNLHVSGYGDFRATFDNQSAVVHYDARDFVLQNDDFALELKNINSEGCASQRYVASHIFEISSGKGYGSIPVRNGTYFEKNSGLLFTDINAAVSLEDGYAHINGLETFCNGIYFAGAIDVDWSMPGAGIFEVDIRAHQMHGKMSQVQHLFTHFKKPLFFFKLPLEGNVDFRNEGGYIHFDFEPNDYHVQTHISGAFTDGVLANQGANLLLQEVSMNFEYDHKANTLEFSDILGTLLVGTPNHFDEYEVAGNRVLFTDYANHESEFDIWVSDKKRDIIRIAGRTFSQSNGFGDSLISIDLNHDLSHFGDVHPSTFELSLKDWSEIDTFQLAFEFKLNTLLQDLQRFSRTGLLFLSRSLLKELNEMKTAEGVFRANLQYQDASSLLTYNLAGTNLVIGHRSFKDFLLAGRKKGSVWTIDQLQLDDISLAFDILKDSNVWNINFLGARFGNALLLGLEGKYHADESILSAKINLLEADLGQLVQWPIIQNILNDWQLSGQIAASGNVAINLERSLERGGVHANVKMNGSLKNCTFKGLCLQDIHNMSLSYGSKEGLILSDVHTALKSPEGNVEVGFVLGKCHCHFKEHRFGIDDLHFSVPFENLPWVANNLTKRFPSFFSPSILEVISNAKKTGTVDGQLKLNISNTQCGLSLMLDDGAYHFLGQEHKLKNFVLHCNPKELNLSAHYQIEATMLGLKARINAPNFDNGQIVLSDLPVTAELNSMPHLPLTISWSKDPYSGFLIQKVEGGVCGMNCDLVRDVQRPVSSDTLHLAGRVEFDVRKSAALLSQEISSKVNSWNVGNGYAMQGLWSISKADGKPLKDSVTFYGELLGNDFEFFGYEFKNMSAQMSYSPNAVHIRNLMVTDPCGSVQVDEMACLTQADERWRSAIPSLKVSGFRPSLLRACTATVSTIPKTFVIKNLELNALSGILGESESFTGYGQLTFANPPKKNNHSIIFAIPAEILMRIGLDLAVLNPVRGVIEYEIKNNRVELKRFKDVYSKGRLSKFYLPNNGQVPYVDFDGNLNMQVRMKQYNLIFKLAELFTVTVQGTLQKPTYTLQKQPKKTKANDT